MSEDIVPIERVERRADAARILEERLLEAVEMRDRAMRDAAANGFSLREIATAAGLSFGRVGQIVRRLESERR